MLKLVSEFKKNVNLKPKLVETENFIFKLHYRITFWLLTISCVLVCSREYIGEKIECLHSDPLDDRKKLEHVIDTFCFFLESTFTVVKHMNKSVNNREIAHPGVGPSTEDEEKIYHKFYQWVPYCLFFQALSFYIPRLIWRENENGRMKALVTGFTGLDVLNAEKKDNSLKKIQKEFTERLQIYHSWAYGLIFCEFLNLVNLILQIYLTDVFLSGQFFNLGPKVYWDLDTDNFNPLDVVFPKVTKCTFRKYGPGGSIQFHDVMCVMALNIINEKIYVTLWFWYTILFIITVLGVLWRFLSYLLHSSTQFNLFNFRLAMQTKLDRDDLIVLMKRYSYSEWLFLRYLASNLDGRLFKELIERMAAEIQNQGPSETDCKLLSGSSGYDESKED